LNSITLNWQQIVKIFSIIALAVAGYYKMLNDIERAMREPRPPISREEYNLKFENTATHILYLKEKVEHLEEEVHELQGSP
jgi:hypothetical protein